jgi:hypothetical protein
MAIRGIGRICSLAAATSWALIIVATGSLPAPAAAAKPAKFAISVSGSDRQVWTVANPGTACTRYGSGVQTVRFASRRSVRASIRDRGGLYFTGHGALRYTLSMDGVGTVTRKDDSVYTPPDPDQPCAAGAARDCGSRALENVHNYRGEFLSDDPEKFHLTLINDNRHLVLRSLYWESAESPFSNCLALKTPEGCCADSPPFWNGPMFGDQLYDGDHGPVTARIRPLALRRNHKYRFTAKRHYTLRVDPNIRINGPNGHGRFELLSSGIPVGDLGGPRSVTHTIVWMVTLRRVG